jgi:PhzF family phenazine biosynthesis protein
MRLRIVDAFTDRPFAGNPAAVCLLDTDSWPDEGWMRRVAAEMHLPATAFAHPLPGDADADWALRWFLPTGDEINLCGHGTLATAHALYSDGLATGTVRFSSHNRLLLAEVRVDGTVTLDFPAAPRTDVAVPDGLVEALGAKPEAAYATGTLGDLLVVLPDEAAVRALTPDFTAVAALTRREGLRGVITTAAAADADRDYDFVSRFFAPADGIPEDPVTGSAHTALAPYWSGRLGRNGLTGLQASARSGLVRTAVHGDRVHLTGSAVTVVEGVLHRTAGWSRRHSAAVAASEADPAMATTMPGETNSPRAPAAATASPCSIMVPVEASPNACPRRLSGTAARNRRARPSW